MSAVPDPAIASVEKLARAVDSTLVRYRERERELYAELVRVTARFDERVRAAVEELHQHVESLDSLALERGSEAQLRRKALGTQRLPPRPDPNGELLALPV